MFIINHLTKDYIGYCYIKKYLTQSNLFLSAYNNNQEFMVFTYTYIHMYVCSPRNFLRNMKNLEKYSNNTKYVLL